MKVDTLLTNAIILTMDEEYRIFRSGAIAIKADSIIEIGENNEIISKFSANEVIDCNGKILMPGLINAHTHVPMTLLRGLSDDLRLDVWLLGYMMPVEREYVNPEFVRLGTKIACSEMIQAGITCFNDMYYFEDDVAEATAEVGMRAVCGESILKFPTPDAQSYEESLAYARNFIIKWKNHPLIVPAIAPHAPYTCTAEILQKAKDLAIEFDVPLHIHIAETATEVENSRNEHGMPVVPYVKKVKLLDAKVIAAHCVHIDPGEMRTFKSTNTGVAHNPSSNLKLASGIAPIRQLMELGVNVGIGTDGPASNNDLDMFEEIRLTTFLAKGVSGDPTTLPAKTTLAMATRIGAKALHIGDITGSLEPGKRADLITINISTTHNTPAFRHFPDAPYSQVVYASKSTDVTDVMVNGKWLMRNKVLLTINDKELLAQAQEYAKSIDRFIYQRESSVISKLVAIGGAHEEESFEVQVKVPLHNAEEMNLQLQKSELQILRTRHYREYDTYFFFEDQDQGRLRYREDHLISDRGEITNVRSRLTLIGVKSESHYQGKVILSRSRYIAPATQSLRFYKEYFNPVHMLEINKDRKRFLVKYKETEFFINIDQFKQPLLGTFLEIKSRTWSQNDADQKSRLAVELLEYLGILSANPITEDYIELVRKIPN